MGCRDALCHAGAPCSRSFRNSRIRPDSGVLSNSFALTFSSWTAVGTVLVGVCHALVGRSVHDKDGWGVLVLGIGSGLGTSRKKQRPSATRSHCHGFMELPRDPGKKVRFQGTKCKEVPLFLRPSPVRNEPGRPCEERLIEHWGPREPRRGGWPCSRRRRHRRRPDW